MSLIAKLWNHSHQQQTQTKSSDERDDRLTSGIGCRNSVDCGAEPVRILLMRECEWRGRKLLFDSIAEDRSKRCSRGDISENNNFTTTCRNSQKNGIKIKDQPDESSKEEKGSATACEHGKLLKTDISLLSEMIFGTVAMMYRGPSFKIHAMDTPRCIMCTKVFPYSEHSICRRGDRGSAETLGKSDTLDSNPSISSLQNNSRSGSGNLSSNSLSPTMRKSSTCSSTGSGWDIDVPRLCSSQSLDGSSTTGSLSSLRRRWHRAVSTSLSRNNSDEAFGRCVDGSVTDESVVPRTKHKTRLGLAILLQLPGENDKQLSERLMEHAALLEGALEQLRHACRGPTHERSLVSRLHRASRCCSLRLLVSFATHSFETFSESPAPLLWHEQLLNGNSGPLEVRVDELQRSVKRMCCLLQQLDTKSTNLFLSTIVTAVLTHHLGWVNSALPSTNRQMLEILKQQYPCNPLWAQLTDLLGALGTPVRVAHTVVAGKASKASLIESVLSFLSYFIRSGLVERRPESRCSDQADVQEAIAILERALRNRSLTPPTTSTTGAVTIPSKRPLRKTVKQLDLAGPSEVSQIPKFCLGDEPAPSVLVELENKEGLGKKLKRSPSSHKSLVGLSGVSGGTLELKSYENDETWKDACPLSSSKVKIVVSKVDELEKKELESLALLKENIRTDLGESSLPEYKIEPKLDALRQQHKLNGFDDFGLDSKALSLQSLIVQPSNTFELSSEAKSTQVYFTLGPEQDKSSLSIRERLKSQCKCERSYKFTRMPSTSAELPEGVLRKIIQRNFPESSKNLRLSEDCEQSCLRCMKRDSFSSTKRNGKLLLQTPTNATEVLRSCASGVETSTRRSSTSLEALIEANCIIELPMPRSKKPAPSQQRSRIRGERSGFAQSLIGSRASSGDGFTWGMVLQGFTKQQNHHQQHEECEQRSSNESEWWQPIRESLAVEAKFPLVDQPVDEAVCVIGDLDTCQVSLLSSSDPRNSGPVPVGMSSLVSNMLEAFVCLWTQFHSPEQCIKLLESRLREMWLRSETLAEFLLSADLSDANVDNLTSYLDVDAADLPLLLAVATTHSPQIAQRFGITLA